LKAFKVQGGWDARMLHLQWHILDVLPQLTEMYNIRTDMTDAASHIDA